MSVADDLKKLAALQDMDSQLQKWETEKSTDPEDLVKLRREVAEAEAQLAAAKEKHDREEMQRRKKEGELQAGADKIRKYKDQLLEVKTNKEYTALLHEIEGAKADNSLLEDEILELMEDIDRLREEVARLEEILGRQKAELAEAEEANKRRVAELEKTMEGLVRDRDALRTQLDPELLSQYDRIRKARRGLAVVRVVGRICQGCHREITHQALNEVMRGEKLIVCDGCARILYLDDEDSGKATDA